MRTVIIKTFVLLFLTVACQTKDEEPIHQMPEPEKKIVTPPVLRFDKVNEKGVLIGYAINLMDTALNEKQDISDYSELMVEITAVSRTYHYSYNSYNPDTLNLYPCQKFRYVKIKTQDFEGIVEGQYVYRLIESPRNKIINTTDNRLEFIATSNYGAKQSGDGYDTPCRVGTPLIFRDKKSHYEGLITILNSKQYGIYFPYLGLDTSKNEESEGYKLKMKGSDFETTIQAKFEIHEFKGDDPVPPDAVRVRRERNGKFTARFQEN